MEPRIKNETIGYVLLDSFSNEDDLIPVLTDQDTAQLIASRRYVLIEETGQRNKKYFAQIIKGPLHTPEWGTSSDGQNVFPIVRGEEIAFVPSFHSYYLAKVLGEIGDDGRLHTAFTRPMPKSQVSYIPKDELYDYLQLTADKTPMGILSNYGTEDPVPFYITDKLVNRQLGIFGSTGSGKSNTVIALAETLLDRGWCVIIFDHAGEYYKLTEPSHETSLFTEYWQNFDIRPKGIDKAKFRRFLPVIDERDDKAALKFSVLSKQVPFSLLKAIMAPLSDAQDRVLNEIRRNLAENYDGLPSIKKAVQDIPDKAKSDEKDKSADQRWQSKPILLGKISNLEALKIFDKGVHIDPGNPDIFKSTIKPNVSYLEASLLIKPSTVNVIDLGNVSSQDVINIIGLTWLNPIVISQQPADIPVGIMSQCVMRITHQLADERDIQIVGKGSAKQFTNMIPDLRKGECLITTPEILAPQIVRIRPAMAKKVDPQTDSE